MKWYEYAREYPLADGNTVYTYHRTCSAVPGGGVDRKERLSITNKGGTYLFKCHHCGDKGAYTPASLRKRKAPTEPEKTVKKALILPSDVVSFTKMPIDARKWLFDAGLHNKEALEYGIVYSPQSNRVILPIYRNGELKAYQARRLHAWGPKYLSYGENAELYLWLPGETGKPLVVVEDYLSAVRVHQLGYSALALFTTTIKKPMLLAIAKTQMQVIVWLDSDNVDVKRKERKLLRELQSLLGESKVFYAEGLGDPKRLTNEQLHALFGELLSPQRELYTQYATTTSTRQGQ